MFSFHFLVRIKILTIREPKAKKAKMTRTKNVPTAKFMHRIGI